MDEVGKESAKIVSLTPLATIPHCSLQLVQRAPLCWFFPAPETTILVPVFLVGTNLHFRPLLLWRIRSWFESILAQFPHLHFRPHTVRVLFLTWNNRSILSLWIYANLLCWNISSAPRRRIDFPLPRGSTVSLVLPDSSNFEATASMCFLSIWAVSMEVRLGLLESWLVLLRLPLVKRCRFADTKPETEELYVPGPKSNLRP